MVAAEVVKFLANNIKRNPLILHGFSVGGYLWGECMMHMSKDIDRYRHVLDQFRGQIWDSVVELTEIPVGVPKAMFPKNDTLQRALGNYMMYVWCNLLSFGSLAKWSIFLIVCYLSSGFVRFFFYRQVPHEDIPWPSYNALHPLEPNVP